MNISHVVTELFRKELHDRLTIQYEAESGKLLGEELKVRWTDHEYHYTAIFGLIWDSVTWEEQIYLAAKYPHNVYFKAFLDTDQETVYRIIK